MPGTRVRPLAGPSVNLVPGIHALVASHVEDVDSRYIGERGDAVLRTAMPGYDDVDGYSRETIGLTVHRAASRMTRSMPFTTRASFSASTLSGVSVGLW